MTSILAGLSCQRSHWRVTPTPAGCSMTSILVGLSCQPSHWRVTPTPAGCSLTSILVGLSCQPSHWRVTPNPTGSSMTTILVGLSCSIMAWPQGCNSQSMPPHVPRWVLLAAYSIWYCLFCVEFSPCEHGFQLKIILPLARRLRNSPIFIFTNTNKRKCSLQTRLTFSPNGAGTNESSLLLTIKLSFFHGYF